MDYDEIYDVIRFEYERTCEKCGIKHLILTREDDDPEYHIEIFLKCVCGNYLEFTLPGGGYKSHLRKAMNVPNWCLVLDSHPH